MRIVTSTTLAFLFIFLAGFNVWTMLSGRGTSRSSRLWIHCHRVAGYGFTLLFALFCYFMALRIRGFSDELSPRLILHIGLALLLFPLILTKVIVARYQKSNRGLLTALGIGIFAISFTLVAVNLGIHFLRLMPRGKVPLTTSVPLAFAVGCLLAIGLVPRRTHSVPQSSAVSIATGPSPARTPRDQDGWLTLTLARVEPQTRDAKTLRFLLPQGKHLAARPGQFLTFEWDIAGKPISRCYSICSSPTQSAYVEITPKRVNNGCVSKFLNDQARPGLTVKARGPYGKFCFDESKHSRVVLLAAGSGITPMMSMLCYIDDLCLPVHVKLIYCVRSEEDVLFKSELAALESRRENFHYALVLSQPSSDWQGWRGRLRREVLESEVEAPLHSTFFLCGPAAFMGVARSLLADISVKETNILQESFGGAVTGSVNPAIDAGAFKITYARSAITCNMSADRTLLESSEANGVLMPSGCREGICGTCATRLISGNVQMGRAEALSEELRSAGYILPCVSRPLDDVVLDA